jgi:quercetin dioxygenase-like cupin family protein
MKIPDYRALASFGDEKMTKVNLFESHRMFADLYCLRPGQSQKLHSHADNDKVYFVLEGRCRCTIGEEEYALAAGESCAARAGEPHGVVNDSDGDTILLVFMAPHPTLKAG